MERAWPGTRPKLVAALVLAGSALLPLYAMPDGTDVPRRHWPAQLAAADGETAVLVAIAYLWPLAVLALTRIPRGSGWRTAAAVGEPVLPFVSVFLLMLLAGSAMGLTHPLGPWLMIPVRASLDIGAAVACAANAAYFVAWAVSGALRSGSRWLVCGGR